MLSQHKSFCKEGTQLFNKKRTYGLGIWGLGLGYFIFYTPYSGLTKALSNGLLRDVGPVPGPVLLPASVMATVVCLLGFITAMKWWKYAGRREFFGISIPFPRRLTFLSGVCTAVIIGTTTLAFTFGGLSIVLVLVLLRGGVLVIAPVIDSLFRRRVRWFSFAAMLVSLLAVLVALSDAPNRTLGLAAIIDVAAYLIAYFFKLQFMTRLAKSDERSASLRYFVEEVMVASPLLLLSLGVMAMIGAGNIMLGFRLGFTSFLGTRAVAFALLIGVFYAGLCICTTLIFLDRRENTFCVPMHCGSSLLAGIIATYVMTLFSSQSPLTMAQFGSGGLMVIALALLSPLHHFDRSLAGLKELLGGVYRMLPSVVTGNLKPATLISVQAMPAGPEAFVRSEINYQDHAKQLPRFLLFVCSGNTCRSPMAAVIGNAEIAFRLKIPFEAVDKNGVHSLSAGVSAALGAPMAREAQQTLLQLGLPVPQHEARSVTVELANQVEKIFCMTQAHRTSVINLVPAAAAKTHCLDPNGDIDDPMGKGMTAYLKCAQRIQDLVRIRFDEIDIQAAAQN